MGRPLPNAKNVSNQPSTLISFVQNALIIIITQIFIKYAWLAAQLYKNVSNAVKRAQAYRYHALNVHPLTISETIFAYYVHRPCPIAKLAISWQTESIVPYVLLIFILAKTFVSIVRQQFPIVNHANSSQAKILLLA